MLISLSTKWVHLVLVLLRIKNYCIFKKYRKKKCSSTWYNQSIERTPVPCKLQKQKKKKRNYLSKTRILNARRRKRRRFFFDEIQSFCIQILEDLELRVKCTFQKMKILRKFLEKILKTLIYSNHSNRESQDLIQCGCNFQFFRSVLYNVFIRE